MSSSTEPKAESGPSSSLPELPDLGLVQEHLATLEGLLAMRLRLVGSPTKQASLARVDHRIRAHLEGLRAQPEEAKRRASVRLHSTFTMEACAAAIALIELDPSALRADDGALNVRENVAALLSRLYPEVLSPAVASAPRAPAPRLQFPQATDDIDVRRFWRGVSAPFPVAAPTQDAVPAFTKDTWADRARPVVDLLPTSVDADSSTVSIRVVATSTTREGNAVEPEPLPSATEELDVRRIHRGLVAPFAVAEPSSGRAPAFSASEWAARAGGEPPPPAEDEEGTIEVRSPFQGPLAARPLPATTAIPSFAELLEPGKLTIEKHAELSAALGHGTEAPSLVLARFGLTLAEKHLEDDRWEIAIRANDATRDRWLSELMKHRRRLRQRAPNDSRSTEPRLTIVEHARLCAELAAAPLQVEFALRRRAISASEREALDAHFREVVTRDAEARSAWNVAYQHHWNAISRAPSSKR